MHNINKNPRIAVPLNSNIASVVSQNPTQLVDQYRDATSELLKQWESQLMHCLSLFQETKFKEILGIYFFPLKVNSYYV